MSFFKSRAFLVVLVLIAIVIACSWPLFNSKIFFAHDFVHGARLGEMALALKDGHFPVRWSSNFGYGYGMPLFEFYAPLPFYIGVVPYLLGLSVVGSVKWMFLSASILTVIGSYLLGKQLYGRTGGLIVAAAISLAPYRALNLFIRGAISEIWGITAAVWITLATVLVIKKGAQYTPLLMLSIAVLLLSHNLVTIIFLPAAGIFAALFLGVQYAVLPAQERTKSFLSSRVISLASSYLLGLGMASFYWLPAFMEKGYTKVEQTITGNYFDFHLHYLYFRQFIRPGWGYGGSEWGPNDPLSFFLGYGQLLGIAVTFFVVLYYLWKKFIKKQAQKTRGAWLVFLLGTAVLGGVSLLFTTEKTVLIWEKISLLKFIQFPWRYLSGALVFIGLLAGGFALFVPQKMRYILAGVLLLLLTIINTQYFKPERYLDEPDSLYYTDPARIQQHMSVVLQDYIPSQMSIKLDMPIIESPYECDPAEACTQVTLDENKVHYKRYSIDITAPTQLIFSVAYYPGWYAQVDGVTTSVSTNKEGHISLDVATNNKTVELFFGATPVRMWADRISAVSGLVVIGWTVYLVVTNQLKKRKK